MLQCRILVRFATDSGRFSRKSQKIGRSFPFLGRQIFGEKIDSVQIGDRAAIFEATHGTAPKHAGLDRINPGSVILSGVMMLEFLGWQEAADLITKGLSQSISDQKVTYDLARLMEPPVPPLSCSEFANSVIKRFES